MKKLIIGLSIGMLFSINLFALSPKVQYDMLKIKLTQQLKDKEYAKVPDTINSIKSLGVSTPKSFDYFEGKALFESGKKAQSYQKFERYVEETGEEGKYYSSAISYLIQAEEAKEREKKAKRIIEQNTWVDSSTGLMWQDNPRKRTRMNWHKAKKYCESLTLAGYSDWYLPNQTKLRSIDVNFKIKKLKSVKKYDEYWSSYRDSSYAAYSIFFDGEVHYNEEVGDSTSSKNHVICVRNIQ